MIKSTGTPLQARIAAEYIGPENKAVRKLALTKPMEAKSFHPKEQKPKEHQAESTRMQADAQVKRRRSRWEKDNLVPRNDGVGKEKMAPQLPRKSA